MSAFSNQSDPSSHLYLDSGDPQAPVDVWWLVGRVDESSALMQIPIGTSPFKIGRKSGLSLSLPSTTVSSVHAEIFESDGAMKLRDLGSTNGTFSNGVRISGDVELHEGDLVQFSTVSFRVCQRPEDVSSGTVEHNACDQAIALCQFDKLISQRAAIPFFQPIIDIRTSELAGYEILGRSRLFGLRTPKEMFLVAAQLNQAAELSRVFRLEGIQLGRLLPGFPNLFVNTHPMELLEAGMLDSLRAVRQLNPDQPITLEIHEAAVTDAKTMHELRACLCDLEIELAYDDFGAGQARLIELVEVCPNYLKYDRQLIHDIHRAGPARQQMLATLVRMAVELGITPLAEGIEVEEEYEVCQQLGFEMAQGFYLGRPAAVNHYVEQCAEKNSPFAVLVDQLSRGEISQQAIESLSDLMAQPSSSTPLLDTPIQPTNADDFSNDENEPADE